MDSVELTGFRSGIDVCVKEKVFVVCTGEVTARGEVKNRHVLYAAELAVLVISKLPPK